MDRCDYCGTTERVTAYMLDSEYAGKTVRLCATCMKSKISDSLRPIETQKIRELILAFQLVNDSPYPSAELKKDDNCSFFLYPYLIGYELFEREDGTPMVESWSREIYRRWVYFLTNVRKLENKRRKESS
ncbi:MAG TPA: hypothetical protein PKM99_07125 [Thermotogota bacterium]|nr:hypothetical protein [Thermotogota bacterium]